MIGTHFRKNKCRSYQQQLDKNESGHLSFTTMWNITNGINITYTNMVCKPVVRPHSEHYILVSNLADTSCEEHRCALKKPLLSNYVDFGTDRGLHLGYEKH